MSFVHPLFLGGLLLIGIPVLIHLIMQQKPKHLLFPAFRFLAQKHRTNQRRLRLRHWLLLALRVLLIAALCLAFARPKLFSERLALGGGRPVAAVLLFDTSYSMGYQVANRSRLDEAKKRALELLEDFPPNSRVAVFDSGESGGDWLVSRAQAEERITALKLRPVNAPLTRQIGQAYRLLREVDSESREGEALPQFLYVLSDRTTACWDATEAKTLHPPEGLNQVFVDVGVDQPADLALVSLELPRPIVHPGDQAQIRVSVRATGADAENEVLCLRVGESTADRRPVKLTAGQSEVKVFERAAFRPGETEEVAGRLPYGFHQFEIQLGATDALPQNNVLYATIKVQEGRRILIVTDHPGKRGDDGDATVWLRALQASHQFPCEARSPKAFAEMAIGDLKKDYEAICLLDVADPSGLWDKLTAYVEAGKGLAVVPGGEDWQPSRRAYNLPEARRLLGAQMLEPVNQGDAAGVEWKELLPDSPRGPVHPLIKPFRDALDEGDHFTDETRPRARHFWKVKPDATTQVLARYADKENSPALLEHRLGPGRVILFTTALDHHLVKNLHANNYFGSRSWFGAVLIVLSTGYLAGDADTPNFNYLCGQTVTVPAPASATPLFTLIGPGITDVRVPRARGENVLRITQAVLPGNYAVFDPDTRQRIASFSLNLPPEETQLDRVPVEQIESLLGSGSVLTVDYKTSLADALHGHWQEPLELFPLLMIVLLIVLAVENLLANKFYRRGSQETL